MTKDIEVKQVAPYIWEVPKTGEMLVPGRIYGDNDIVEHLLDDIRQGKDWNALKQIVNVACLPGIQTASLAMADVHPGYGFCIGGVGAFDLDEGLVTVAGVGFDINCGVRLLHTPLTVGQVEPLKEKLAEALFRTIPAGVGSKGKIRLSLSEINQVLIKGARYVVGMGMGTEDDLLHTEERGCIAGADPDVVSMKAKQRQFQQIGTLGSGNHYLEVQRIEEIYDQEAARAFELEVGKVMVAIHCGSRALGHQIGTDYLKDLARASKKYNIKIRDRELVAAPVLSPEGKRYISAMNCGINCAFANRQALTHLARTVVAQVANISPDEVRTFYDVGHNTAKIETHEVDGATKKLLIHRKGSTRAFGPGREELPERYRPVGQPVLVGGTMGTCSYVLRGTEKGMQDTFGSAIHGAGRAMSRMRAKKLYWGATVISELGQQGIIIRSKSKAGVAEEAPGAYKDINAVVEVMHQAGINRKVAMLRPMICIKG